jgi:hypothetical protein
MACTPNNTSPEPSQHQPATLQGGLTHRTQWPKRGNNEKKNGCTVPWAYRFVLVGHACGRPAAATCSSPTHPPPPPYATRPPPQPTTPTTSTPYHTKPPSWLFGAAPGGILTMASVPPRTDARSAGKKHMSCTWSTTKELQLLWLPHSALTSYTAPPSKPFDSNPKFGRGPSDFLHEEHVVG